jgi:ribosomal protein S15P/S13E
MLPFTQKRTQENRQIVEGSGSFSAQGNARIKVEQDIAFLTDRIKVMQAHPNPNHMLIEHYQSILKSRESVLKWLLDGCDDETCFTNER